MADFAAFNAAYAEAFGSHAPAFYGNIYLGNSRGLGRNRSNCLRAISVGPNRTALTPAKRHPKETTHET